MRIEHHALISLWHMAIHCSKTVLANALFNQTFMISKTSRPQ